jgi:hypothetical protein
MKNLKFLLIFATLCFACNPDKIDTRRVKKEIEDRKIKKIPEGEIISTADSTGNAIVEALQKIISKRLDSALTKGNLEGAIPFCVLSNYPEKSQIEQSLHATISRTSFPDRLMNPKNAPDELQKQLLEAYSYNLEKNLSLFSNVQVLPKEIAFFKPIFLTEKQCLKCHGTPGKDLTEAEYQKLLSQYPGSKSTKLKMNDFMGMWTVKFDKAEFIKNLK